MPSSKMSSYHITEPHPSLTNTIKYGRGGAGNTTRAPILTNGPNASGPASRINLPPPPSNGFFTSGRGGAGNVHREHERAMFSFDEELAAQERLREHAAPIYHIGRGGAGNLVSSSEDGQHRMYRANSASSAGSADSEKDGVRRSIEGAWHRVSRQFSRPS